MVMDRAPQPFAKTFWFWLVAYAAARLMGPYVPIPNPWGGWAGALLFITLSLGLILAAARMDIAPWKRAAFIFGGLGLKLALWGIGLQEHAWGVLVADMALIVGATHFGGLVALLIREPKLLLPVALCAALVDVWGVSYGGPVYQLRRRAPSVVEQGAARVPALGSARPQRGRRPPPPLLIGLGDFLFLGLFFSCVVRFGMNTPATLLCTGVATLIGLVSVVGFGRALPGLPFLGLGVILPNIKHFSFTREEKFALLYAGLLLTPILGIAVWLGGRETR